MLMPVLIVIVLVLVPCPAVAADGRVFVQW